MAAIPATSTKSRCGRCSIWAIGDASTDRPAGYPRIADHADELLLGTWSARKVGDATNEACDAHMKTRCETISSHTGDFFRPRSARAEIDAFLAMIRKFAAARGIKNTLQTRYGKIPIDPVDGTLSRHEIIRLVHACSGWRWNGSEMCRDPDADIRQLARRRRDHMARYVLLASMLGTKDGLMRRLRWHPAADGDPPHSWVDLDRRELHRLGPDLSKLKKYHGVPVRIPRWLVRHMRRWRRHDSALGVTHVLGLVNAGCKRFNAFERIRDDAGFDDSVTLQTLIDTFAATAMRRSGTSSFGLAIALGIEIRQVKLKYEHFRPDFMAGAVAGTRRRPAALRRSGEG